MELETFKMVFCTVALITVTVLALRQIRTSRQRIKRHNPQRQQRDGQRQIHCVICSARKLTIPVAKSNDLSKKE